MTKTTPTLSPAPTTSTPPASTSSTSSTPSELQASGRVLARLAQAMAMALVAMERERLPLLRPRPVHRV